MPELCDWQFVGSCLTGRVYGHKRFADGTHIRTSKVKSVKGRWAQTVSGTVYRLRNKLENSVSLDSPSQDVSIIEEEDRDKRQPTPDSSSKVRV